MAVLKKLPIIYLVQDNDWGISATGKEMRAMDAYEYAAGFKGMERMAVDGADFIDSFLGDEESNRVCTEEKKSDTDPREMPVAWASYVGCKKRMVSR